MKQITRNIALLAITLFVTTFAFAQVTTSSMSGKVTEVGDEEAIPGAVIVAVHTPSGSKYFSTTDANGFYRIQNMRIGGPYSVEVSFLGYATRTFEGISLNLAENRTLNVELEEESLSLDATVVYAEAEHGSVGDGAGATTTINIAKMNSLPIIGRSVESVMKLTPQAYNSGSGPQIGGGTYRQNYFTVDGAAFNNAFGIGNSMPAGGSPISMDALEQVSVSVTPFDVRQSGFLGASMNAVTRSGSNKFQGSAYSYFHNQDFRGNKIGDVTIVKNDELNLLYGARVGGPIIKDKLFFFLNVEAEYVVSPGSSKVASTPGAPYTDGKDGISRPEASKLDELSTYLNDTYGYKTGPYQGYSSKSPAFKILGRVDWNISNNHKLNVRYNFTKSSYPAGPSTSTSGYVVDRNHVGGSRGSATALNFQNSAYFQEQNFSSFAAELNSSFGDGKFSNLLRATYSNQHEPRSTEGGYLPSVDIAEEGNYYTTFGSEAFSFGNLRDVRTILITDEFTASLGRFNLIAGLQFEHNKTKNGFQRAGAGYYQYDSLEDFYNDKPYQFGITNSYNSDYSQAFPQFDFNQLSFYLQADARITDNFKLTAGVRFEVPFYPSLEGNYNDQVGEAILKEFHGNGGKYDTTQLPATSLMISPRVGFSWDITGDRRFVLRGGSGLFTGRLPFVWIVAQATDSGVLQNTYMAKEGDGKVIPSFSNDRTAILDQIYPNGLEPGDQAPISSVTLMDQDLRMPQTWKSSLAFDVEIPGGFRASVEGIYNYDVNPITVENIAYDLPTYSAVPNYSDNRLLWTSMLPTNNGLSYGAYLLRNSDNPGWYYSVTAKLEKTYWKGLSGMVAYTYSDGKSLSDGWGDQVFSHFQSAATIQGNGLDELGNAAYIMPHRLIGSISYRVEYARNFATSVSLWYDGGPQRRDSYTYNENVVGDGGGENLIYIPKTKDELTFSDYTPSGWDEIYTKEAQAEDFWNYVNSDKSLKDRKGDYAERNGLVFPWAHQFDVKINQDFYVTTRSGDRHTLQLGLDIVNIANLFNKDWGHKFYLGETEILRSSKRKVGAVPVYNFNTVGNSKLTPDFTSSASFSSTWQMQLSVRYIF